MKESLVHTCFRDPSSTNGYEIFSLMFLSAELNLFTIERFVWETESLSLCSVKRQKQSQQDYVFKRVRERKQRKPQRTCYK